jgi:hypothetical protein
MVIQPPGMKSKIENRGNQLLIKIPSVKIWLAIFATSFFLVVWIYGEVNAIRRVLFGIERGETFLGLWLCVWTYLGIPIVRSVLWMSIGKEVVSVDSDGLIIKKDVLGFGMRKHFDLVQVFDLRVSKQPKLHWNSHAVMSGQGFSNGMIAFDYGSSTVRFAAGIDGAEAKKLVDTLLTHNAGFAKAQ